MTPVFKKGGGVLVPGIFDRYKERADIVLGSSMRHSWNDPSGARCSRAG